MVRSKKATRSVHDRHILRQGLGDETWEMRRVRDMQEERIDTSLDLGLAAL